MNLKRDWLGSKEYVVKSYHLRGFYKIYSERDGGICILIWKRGEVFNKWIFNKNSTKHVLKLKWHYQKANLVFTLNTLLFSPFLWEKLPYWNQPTVHLLSKMKRTVTQLPSLFCAESRVPARRMCSQWLHVHALFLFRLKPGDK